MAATPIELVTVGKVPAREGGLLTSAAPSVVEVFPGVFLIASIVRAKNQCVLELVQPAPTTAANSATTADVQRGTVCSPTTNTTGSSLSTSSSPPAEEVQRRLSEFDGFLRRPTSAPATTKMTSTTTPAAVVPVALRSAFRVPRVIQLVAEDEGVIENVSLVREPLGTAFVAALEEQDRSTSQNPLRETSNNSTASAATTAATTSSGSAGVAGVFTSASTPSVHHVHVHLFIGTSNGTVIVGNALRGTILAVAQFQYHHLFTSELRGTRSSTTATTAADEERESEPNRSRTPAKNQAVVKFVVRERRGEQLWNPSLPFTQESTTLTNADAASTAFKKTLPLSPTAGSRLASIYIVHSGGKVVELTRAALDVFVRCSVDRLDGRRPHLILEWEPETAPSSFPVAGPASDFAAHVGGVFVLEPPSAYATLEKRSATAKSATPESTHFSIRDADIVAEMPEPAPASSQASALLAPLDAHRRPCEALLVSGSSPLFAFYRLQSPTSGFSAAKAVKAVKSMVTGVARTLWFSALGTTNPTERPPHLKKVATPGGRVCLQADAKCAALQVDPSQQWAAFAIEGGGRVYVADVRSGVISGVLKGCRAAQFTWWWTECAAGGPALLLVVYLPLRRAVEVYTPRTGDRLAACYAPEGCVLLRPCGVPCEWRKATAAAGGSGTTRSPVSGRLGASACSGCGSAALLMDPAGTVYEVRVSWVSSGLCDGAARLRLLSSPSEQSPQGADNNALLSPSVLRGCRSPDDFLEVALQLPLPQPRVVWDTTAASPIFNTDGVDEEQEDSGSNRMTTTRTYAVQSGDDVRSYCKTLDVLCATVQRRFAPGYADIVEVPMPGTAQQALEGSLAAVPRNTSAAQCLHYVQLYGALTENYYRLLRCRRVSPARYFDPTQWTSGLITPQLWTANFSTADCGATAAFAKQMEECMAGVLAAFPAEQSIYKKYFTPFLHQAMRKAAPLGSLPTAGTMALGEPADFMPLTSFLRCFYCGGRRPTFLSGAIDIAEDADGSVNFLGPLSDLVFGMLGSDAFFAQLPVLSDLGCTDRDVALLMVVWVARQAGRSLDALLSTSTVGLFAATLLTFSGTHFLHAVDRAAIPFVSVDGDVATATAAGSVAGLLWCCAVRLALRPSTSLASSQRLTRRVRQLLQLWSTLTKGTPTPQLEQQCASSGSDARIAFSLRLSSVEPPSLPLTAADESTSILFDSRDDIYGGSLAAGAAAGGASEECWGIGAPEGDTFEVYLQRNGITLSLMDDFAVPRPEADADAVRHLPLFSSLVSLLGATEHVRSRGSSTACDSPDVVTSLPWIDGHQWDEERFRDEVCRPLERLWQQLSTSSSTAKAASSSAFKNAFRGGAASVDKASGRAAVHKACLLLVAMRVLDHALRPLTDLSFFFWDNNLVPDGNFFPVDGSPAGLVLAGSRTSRDYLKSVQRLAALVERIIQEGVAPLDNAERVVLIQQISSALSEDDALLFPLIPNSLRARLTVWMQVLAQAPHAPLRRVQRVARLVALLLFFSEASALTMNGVALTQLQSQMTVPWSALIGGANRRDQLRLLPDVFLNDAASPHPALPGAFGPVLSTYAMEDESPHETPLRASVAAVVLRRFLVAGSVLYSQQHGMPPPAASASAALPPAPLVSLISEDTRQCLSRLAHCLGLHESLPDIADVVLMDYEVKHLFPVAAVEQEMLLLSTKTAAPHVGLVVLQCYLVSVLQYATALRKGYGQRGERAAFELASERLRKLVGLLSTEGRAWLQERETQMLAAAKQAKEGSTKNSTSPSAAPSPDVCSDAAVPMEGLLCDPSWVTVAEFEDLRRLVYATLGLPKGTPERKNFFRLLFTLAQWACEGRLTLPVPLQRIARELPLVVEGWTKIV